MAKTPKATAANSPPKPAAARPASAPAPLAADQRLAGGETDEQREERERAAKEAAEKASQLAAEQRQALADGETGQEQADALKGEDGTAPLRHSIANPQAVPVDYGAQSLRRPAQTILPGESPFVVNRPYGSEPATIDPATGLPAVAKPTDEQLEDANGDDTAEDADTDRGSSASMRADRAAE
jgi:hypothetical protein